MREAEVKRHDIKLTPHIIWIELGLCSVKLQIYEMDKST